MAFDLTDEQLSETFKHLLQVRDTDKTIYDALGNKLEDFRLSGSFTTSGDVKIEGNVSGSSATTGSFGFLEASNIVFELDDNGDIMPI
jgi:formylmethanofuran dehydrogenase subunit C